MLSTFEWAIAAVAVVDAQDRPLFTEVFYSKDDILSLAAPHVQANLVVTHEEELHLQFLMHAALDVCHERASTRYVSSSSVASSSAMMVNSPGGGGAAAETPAPPSMSRTSGAADVRFFDRLLEETNRCVHGFQSASGIRVLLVTLGEAPRDAVLPICRSVYELASSTMCAPFRSISTDSLHTSRKFISGLQATIGPFTATSRSGRSV
ncbi:Hypothetical protein, putative [Bodo saltans]|uniref:Sedlin n=1 Tax=Bodo saltans TaxID=75058 RepID=A0A0S4IP16_BODSA|nr:Hypothetical protein, putative [Bodo saltans]|eukprot:CUF76756.1 Hypothetical protein, putative [Bodo saltans]